MSSNLDTVLGYHQRTKHHLQRYAVGPHGLDWNSQPDPFRRFAGSPQLALPLLTQTDRPRYVELYQPGAITPQAMTMPHVSALLELAFGLSARKQYGDSHWFLRCNPSSGNLHPTEAYVIRTDGVFHYMSHDHALEQRCQFNLPANESQQLLPPESLLIGLTSIHWREAWKYGERAFRYCQHDAGHAIAAVRYAAATLGWQAQLLTSWSDADISTVLGLERADDFGDAEREHSDVMLLVSAQRLDARLIAIEKLVHAVCSGQWHGHANVLSPTHLHDWPVIEAVTQVCTKPTTAETVWQPTILNAPLNIQCESSAVTIIKQRRSAQAFDGVTSIPAHTFYRMLDMTLPRTAIPPWDAIDWMPHIHLALFVHRIDGLTPGLYILVRNGDSEAIVRATLSPEFQWERVPDCPVHMLLYRLVTGNVQDAARILCCHQDIAADGAFSLGMLAEYSRMLAPAPWRYRQLFWEAGILGQVLYLEAEAAGVRGTGIGCYFDDAVHDVLGIKDQTLQSMYHFTVGGALADSRLQTLPAYAQLQRI